MTDLVQVRLSAEQIRQALAFALSFRGLAIDAISLSIVAGAADGFVEAVAIGRQVSAPKLALVEETP